MNSVLIVVLAFMALQSLASMLQVKYYQRFIQQVTEAYKGRSNYEFYTDVSKGFLMKTVIAVVLDEKGKIITCYLCRGFTIFAKFRQLKDFNGRSLAEIHQREVEQVRLTQAETLLNKIYSRKLQATS